MSGAPQLPSAFPASAERRAANDDGLAYCQVGVPHELREAVERHHQHMTVLAAQLRQDGLPDDTAKAYIDAAMDSYRHALVKAAVHLRTSAR